MRKPLLSLFAAMALLSPFALTGAQAMPISPLATPATNVENVRWVCNEWGRCWYRRDYYAPYGYYRSYDDDWAWRPRRRYYAPRYYYPGYGYGGWRRGWYGRY